MLSHVYVGINDFEPAFGFYSALLTELGARLRFNDASKPWAAWMPAAEPRPLLVIGKPYDGEPAGCGNGQMIALLGDITRGGGPRLLRRHGERRLMRRSSGAASAISRQLLRRLLPRPGGEQIKRRLS